MLRLVTSRSARRQKSRRKRGSLYGSSPRHTYDLSQPRGAFWGVPRREAVRGRKGELDAGGQRGDHKPDTEGQARWEQRLQAHGAPRRLRGRLVAANVNQKIKEVMMGTFRILSTSMVATRSSSQRRRGDEEAYLSYD